MQHNTNAMKRSNTYNGHSEVASILIKKARTAADIIHSHPTPFGTQNVPGTTNQGIQRSFFHPLLSRLIVFYSLSVAHAQLMNMCRNDLLNQHANKNEIPLMRSESIAAWIPPVAPRSFMTHKSLALPQSQEPNLLTLATLMDSRERREGLAIQQLNQDIRAVQQIDFLIHCINRPRSSSFSLEQGHHGSFRQNFDLLDTFPSETSLILQNHMTASSTPFLRHNLQNLSQMVQFPHRGPIETSSGMRNASGNALSLPISLARSIDVVKMSEHQYFLRQQIEVFQANEEDVSTHIRGRNKPVSLGQVGIRCRHCAHLPVMRRQKGSTYYPANILGIYQAAQNMSTTHIQCGLCSEIPASVKMQFARILMEKTQSSHSGAGRPYWASSATQLGLVDTEDAGIRFINDIPPGVSIVSEEE